MKTVFIAPFSMDRLTGTPIRAKTTIRARAETSDVHVIATSAASVNLLPDRISSLGQRNILSFTAGALAVLRREQPDFVHGFTSVSMLPMFVYKICFKPRARIIFEMHGWSWYEQSRQGKPLSRLMLLVLDLTGLWFASGVIAVSNSYRDFLKRKTWKTSRIIGLWDPAEFDVAYEPPPPHTGIVVGYIGGNAWWQGLDALIGAAKILSRRKDISFRIAGFEASDEQLFPKLPNITYPGYIQREHVVEFIRECDITISTRIEETAGNLQFPHKVSEYMASGRAVIMSGASDQPQIIRDAGCGILVTPMNPEGLARAIETVAAMTEQEREEWGKCALRYARAELLYSSFQKKLNQFYERFDA